MGKYDSVDRSIDVAEGKLGRLLSTTLTVPTITFHSSLDGGASPVPNSLYFTL